MTQKEKAAELVLKYLRIDNNTTQWFNLHIAKQCALIAVAEIINNLKYPDYLDYRYWEDVETEINNI